MGYKTYGIVTSGFFHPKWGVAKGWDKFSFIIPRPRRGEHTPNEELMDYLRTVYNRDANNGFYFIQTMYPHGPFHVNNPYGFKFTGKRVEVPQKDPNERSALLDFLPFFTALVQVTTAAATLIIAITK